MNLFKKISTHSIGQAVFFSALEGLFIMIFWHASTVTLDIYAILKNKYVKIKFQKEI